MPWTIPILSRQTVVRHSNQGACGRTIPLEGFGGARAGLKGAVP